MWVAEQEDPGGHHFLKFDSPASVGRDQERYSSSTFFNILQHATAAPSSSHSPTKQFGPGHASCADRLDCLGNCPKFSLPLSPPLPDHDNGATGMTSVLREAPAAHHESLSMPNTISTTSPDDGSNELIEITAAQKMLSATSGSLLTALLGM